MTKGWALVTGASRRIGRAIALDLATHGWDIIVHYHHSALEAQRVTKEIHELGRDACMAEIDLSDQNLAESLIPSLAEEIGMIDALINNAALFESDEMDPDGSRHWAVNADAPRILSKAFRDHLPKKERGVIINLLDATMAAKNFTAYDKSKRSLKDITLNMAKSFAPQVRVNGVAPLYVLPSARQSQEAFLNMAQGNLTPPEEVAKIVRGLIDEPTLTGQILTMQPKAQ